MNKKVSAVNLTFIYVRAISVLLLFFGHLRGWGLRFRLLRWTSAWLSLVLYAALRIDQAFDLLLGHLADIRALKL